MKTTATAQSQQETYQPSGKFLQIYWNEQEHQRDDMGEVETYYTYDYCNALVTDSYQQLVIKIIRSQYSVDDEFAAINDGGERHAEFLAFRTLAKSLAQGWVDSRNV